MYGVLQTEKVVGIGRQEAYLSYYLIAIKTYHDQGNLEKEAFSRRLA